MTRSWVRVGGRCTDRPTRSSLEKDGVSNPMRIILTVLLFALAATTALGAGTITAQTSATAKSLNGLSGSAFDAAFFKALIPVHEEAVEIAMAATLNADHKDLLKWNQRIVERKNAQVRQMVNWLHKMGSRPGKRVVGVQTASVKKIRTLKSTGLEKVYIPMMASHLDQSAAIAAVASKKASKPEYRAFAAGIVKVEKQESNMLRGWLRKWYGF